MIARNVWILLISAGALLVVSAIFGLKGPLQDVHWDAPIYIARAKQFAETAYLRDYMSQAAEIAESLPRWKIGEDTAYWGFIRLGNTILLGIVTSLMGANIASIYASFWLYTIMLAAALVTGVLLVIHLVEVVEQNHLPRSAITVGAIVSGGLYLTSDVYRYLSGNLVSEVPALLLLAGAALTLVLATKSRSIILGIASGTLAFALYVVRLEGVWAYIAFQLVFTGMLVLQGGERIWLRPILASGSTALLLYLCYAWLFWPLADPRLLLVFAAGVQGAPQTGIPAVKLLVAAGGTLWIGLSLAVYFCRSNRMFWFALSWLVLLLVPHMDALLGRRQTEMRMYALNMLPLLLASAVGWAAVADRAASGKLSRALIPVIATLAMAVIAVSQTETYQSLRQLPGGWRLQFVREWLSPPSYERLSYSIDELSRISQFVYGRREATILVPVEGKLEENFRIISYLAPKHAQGGRDVADHGGGLTCRGRILRPRSEHVMFCTEPPSSREVGDSRQEVQVLYFREKGTLGKLPGHQNEKIVFQTEKLELVDLSTL